MKILISDYDNTITQNYTVPLRNLEAVNRFRKEGNLFIICTGRGISDQRVDFNEIDHDGIIACGGAYISIKDTLIEKCINDDISAQVIDFLFNCKECLSIKIDSKNREYLMDDWYFKKEKDYKQTNAVFNNKPDGIRVMSAEFYDEKQAMKFKNYLDEHYGNYITSSVNLFFIDITCKDANKVNACRTIQQLYPDAEIHTIGDGCNDLEMIKAFDGACVSNAAEEVKSQVSHVYDMFADYVDNLLLNK